MNTDQNNITEMQIGVGAYMIKNNAVWLSNKAIAAVVKELNENNAVLQKKRGHQETVLEGQVDLKKSAKDILVENIIDIGDQLCALAYKTKNVVLADQSEVSATGLRRLPGEALVEKGKQISKLATDNLAALADYNITQLEIDALDAAIKEFETDKTAPAIARAEREGETKTIPVAIHDNEVLLKKQLDKMVTRLRKTNPEFYAGYHAARVIIDRRAHRKQEPPTPPTPPPA